ncbi:MAG: HNH endonuclease, partial [Methylibium sp.]
MAVSVRTRFEVFKRDDFTCAYCGRRSPDVVLQVDHILAVANGGSDDSINLITSCWECNSGKSDVPLARTLTAEDPHDRAIALLERERQLAEYNRVLAAEAERRSDQAWDLAFYWEDQRGQLNEAQQRGEAPFTFNKADLTWLKSALAWCPS